MTMASAKAACYANAAIYTPEGIIEGGRLSVDENGRIAAIGGAELTVPADVPIHDASGQLLVPGFIDVHIHGGNGFSVMAGEREHLDGISRFHAKHGTTSFLATTTTAPLVRILHALDAASSVVLGDGLGGAELIGIHLEGPYLDVLRRGAQSIDDIRTPSAQEIELIVEAARQQIRLVTIAPEVDGGMEAVRQLAGLGITVSAGHSNATYEQVREAVRAGLNHTTHHFNGMSPLHHREPGLAGAGLTLNELTCELICDGIHVHPAVVKLLFDVKGPSKVCMITDAVTCAGLPDGDYGNVTMHDGQIYLKDGSSLAGSALTMGQALRNAISFTGLSLAQVLPSLSLVPARQIGVSAAKGSLEAGKDADFVLLDAELHVQQTVVRGRTVYRRDSDE
ncbi:N-acetylglucosamine-6-phosphate deacetylase [Paenibacillus sp. OV219]|uniref:N-acetylglucosamine-6-phosphate deacetylase n=1 Tax=Paenibacillus sp. OV219 TaxID=1884377 RepID=UPI0008B6AD1E|nr:N-acetylglucosamine-6-phosphate deacetylase [Paenibacillus sp. OV219]SEN87427.1 N-acetylglucosamine 6-phosphate deacetylase [Paenibacillus sp. OV219]